MMLSVLSFIPRCSAVVLRRTIVEQPSGDGKTYDSNGLPNGASLTRSCNFNVYHVLPLAAPAANQQQSSLSGCNGDSAGASAPLTNENICDISIFGKNLSIGYHVID